MTPLVLALALAGQYPSPQAPQYGSPQTYAAPVTYAAAPVTYAAPQVVMLGAAQVAQPGPFALMLGHLGRKLEKHAWPRVQPMTVQPAMQQTVYLQVQMSPPAVMQAAPSPLYSVGPAPPATYAAPPPQSPMKAPPTPYSSPQAPQYGSTQPQAPQPASAKSDESVPPVPHR